MMNIAHPPSRPANDHADKAALFDSINFPGADEDLLVELSVPVKTIGASGRAVSNTTVLHFPLEVRQELSEPGLQGQFQQQRRKPHITSLTSSPIAPYCSRPGTPIPREPAEEDHSCTQPLPAFKRTTSVVDIHRRADGHQADHLRVKHSDTSGHRLKPAFMLPGFIEDQTAHLRAAVPTRIMPLSPFPLMMPESSNASKYEVTYKAVVSVGSAVRSLRPFYLYFFRLPFRLRDQKHRRDHCGACLTVAVYPHTQYVFTWYRS